MKKQKKQKDQRQIHNQKLSNCDKQPETSVENKVQAIEYGQEYYEAVEDHATEE